MKSLAGGETLGLVGSRIFLSQGGGRGHWVCVMLRVCLTGTLRATINADGTAFL